MAAQQLLRSSRRLLAAQLQRGISAARCAWSYRRACAPPRARRRRDVTGCKTAAPADARAAARQPAPRVVCGRWHAQSRLPEQPAEAQQRNSAFAQLLPLRVA